MKAKDFTRKQLKHCVGLYLDTAMSFSGCAREFGVSVGMFQKLIERAIVERVATDAEVQAITVKAANNCYDYGGEGGAKIAENKYARLRANRLTYKFSDAEKAKYTTRYAMADDELKVFCGDEYIPMEMMVDAIKCSIKDVLITDVKVLNWLTYNLIYDDTAGAILIELDHLLDLHDAKLEASASHKEQLSFLDT